MIDTAFELLCEGFRLLLIASWRALPLLLIAGSISLLFRGRLAPRYHALLWSLVICRLLLPVSAPSELSLHGPLKTLIESQASTDAQALPPVAAPYETTNIQAAAGGMDLQPLPLYATAAAPDRGIDVTEVVILGLLSVWLGIAMIAIGRMALAHWCFARHLSSCRQLTDAPLVDLILRECDSLRVSRRPRVREVPELAGPAVFGLFRSTICLPPGTSTSLSTQELRLLLRHELAHVRRKDAWLYTLASIAQSLHWFNPLAWFAASRLRLYVEAAADELALSNASTEDARVYGNLLVSYAEQDSASRRVPVIGLLHFGSGGRLKQRIVMLAPRRAQRRWVQATLMLAVLSLAIAGLTDAAVYSPTQAAEINLPDIANAEFKSSAQDEGPVSERSYDVTEVLKKVAELEPEADGAQYLTSFVQSLCKSSYCRGEQLTVVGTDRQHLALSTMLDAWRIEGPKQVVVEIRIIAADATIDSTIDWFEGRITGLQQRGSQPVIAARVSDDQLRQFIQRAQGDARSNVLTAPKVTLFNGQSGTMNSCWQRPFVTNVEFRGRNALQPVVDLVEEGLSLMVQPVVRAQSDLALTFELRASKLESVELANLPIRYPDQPNTKVTVQVPRVAETTIGGTVFLTEQQSILIAAPRSFDGEHSADSTNSEYVVLTPRIIQPCHAAARAVHPPHRVDENTGNSHNGTN